MHTASFIAVLYRRDEGGKGRAKAMGFWARGDKGGGGAGGSGQGAGKGMGGEGSSEEKLRRWKAEAKVDHLNFLIFFWRVYVCVLCVCASVCAYVCVCVCMCVSAICIVFANTMVLNVQVPGSIALLCAVLPFL